MKKNKKTLYKVLVGASPKELEKLLNSEKKDFGVIGVPMRSGNYITVIIKYRENFMVEVENFEEIW